MSFPRYSAFKDSATEWLGEVPAHWTVCALSYRYSVQLGKMLDEKRITGNHLGPYLRNVDVQWGRINVVELPEMDFRDEDLRRFSLLKGDLLVCEGGEVGRSAIWNGDIEPCFYQKALHRLRPYEPHDDTPTFLFYVMFAAAKMGVFSGSEGKATIVHLPAETLRRYRFPFPPLSEQTAIAAFLDRETAKIDALVEEQQRLIALLKEKRQAIISHAVTKGLDPNAPMKDSGVEWLGEVPAHWRMKRLKRISPFITVGIVVNPSDYVADEGLPFIYGGDIAEGRIHVESARRISAADSERNIKTRLAAGDLVTVRVGAPGVTSVVPNSCEGGNCASVMLIRKGSFSSNWLCYVMNSRVVRYQVEVVQYGAAQEQFNISHAVNFLVPCPDQKEQSLIAEYLDREATKTEELIEAAETAILLLQERRSSLISAAVTGKIDVRGLAPVAAEAA